MTARMEVYKCELCGNIVEVLHGEGAPLVCCGEQMKKKEEQTADFATEKHVPVVEKTANGIKVIVGSTLHPMADDHFIEWIEVVNGPWVNRKYLKPGDKPEAEFYVPYSENLIVREYCNKHGLWKK